MDKIMQRSASYISFRKIVRVNKSSWVIWMEYVAHRGKWETQRSWEADSPSAGQEMSRL
jgi:hypothetical protein